MSTHEITRIPVSATFTCPYCSHENKHPADASSRHADNRFFVYCDQESGGCDELVAVQVSVRTMTTAFKLVQGDE